MNRMLASMWIIGLIVLNLFVISFAIDEDELISAEEAQKDDVTLKEALGYAKSAWNTVKTVWKVISEFFGFIVDFMVIIVTPLEWLAEQFMNFIGWLMKLLDPYVGINLTYFAGQIVPLAVSIFIIRVQIILINEAFGKVLVFKITDKNTGAEQEVLGSVPKALQKAYPNSWPNFMNYLKAKSEEKAQDDTLPWWHWNNLRNTLVKAISLPLYQIIDKIAVVFTGIRYGLGTIKTLVEIFPGGKFITKWTLRIFSLLLIYFIGKKLLDNILIFFTLVKSGVIGGLFGLTGVILGAGMVTIFPALLMWLLTLIQTTDKITSIVDFITGRRKKKKEERKLTDKVKKQIEESRQVIGSLQRRKDTTLGLITRIIYEAKKEGWDKDEMRGKTERDHYYQSEDILREELRRLTGDDSDDNAILKSLDVLVKYKIPYPKIERKQK